MHADNISICSTLAACRSWWVGFSSIASFDNSSPFDNKQLWAPSLYSPILLAYIFTTADFAFTATPFTISLHPFAKRLAVILHCCSACHSHHDCVSRKPSQHLPQRKRLAGRNPSVATHNWIASHKAQVSHNQPNNGPRRPDPTIT